METPVQGTESVEIARQGDAGADLERPEASSALRYKFVPVDRCDMCGCKDFKLLGMRLNRSQGLHPRRVGGIAVSVQRCRDCGLIFADPQPIPEDLTDHYGMPPEDYWNELYWPPDFFLQEVETAKRLLSFRPEMTALDVGAGLGNAMRVLTQSGFDTWGLEPSKPFHDRAIREIDPARLKLAAIEEAEFPANSFDFITFGAVLEHLYSPALALARAMHWLKPGGIIEAEVPSSDHLIPKLINAYFRLRGTNYVTHISPMHPPYHLYEFSLESFRNFNVAEYGYEVSSIYNIPKLLHPPLRWWMKRTNSGMQLSVYLRK